MSNTTNDAYKRIVSLPIESNKILNFAGFCISFIGLVELTVLNPLAITAIPPLIYLYLPIWFAIPFFRESRDKIQQKRNEIATDIFNGVKYDRSFQEYILYLRPFFTSGRAGFERNYQDAEKMRFVDFNVSMNAAVTAGVIDRGDMELQFGDTLWTSEIPLIAVPEVKILEINGQGEVILDEQGEVILEIDEQGEVKRLKINDKGKISIYEKDKLRDMKTKIHKTDERGKVKSIKLYEQGMGAGRIQEEFGDDWLNPVSKLAKEAKGIIVTIASDGGVSGDGTNQEMEMLKKEDMLNRTLFFVPAFTSESNSIDFQEQWQRTRAIFYEQIGLYLPDFKETDFDDTKGYFLKYLRNNLTYEYSICVATPVNSFKQMYFPTIISNSFDNIIKGENLLELIKASTYNDLKKERIKYQYDSEKTISLINDVKIKVKFYSWG
ncbi:hypothetical protein LC613_43000 [Nostoc sphaeroides CHAB 2801]|uniref:hypothetical protein n=1 Tax=Nostoc sphaeroides TaxID=446679 RepID=UPI001E4FBC44|nr:hypothetical protein [Nostoc sphaeroides]MCC5634172.1 hypothetical protein [Nostoc sphaeroides CHAB 2801]